jgi:hypothetical protein
MLNVVSTQNIAETYLGLILRLLISNAFYQLFKDAGSLGCSAHAPSHDPDLEGD